MLVELDPTDFRRARPLADDPLLGIEARAVVEGHSPGWVFVDDVDRPRSALVCSRGIEGFYLVGDPHNEPFCAALDAFVDGRVTALAHSLGWSYFEVSGVGAGWDAAIIRIFARRKLESDGQIILRRPSGPAAEPLEAARRIDQTLIDDPVVRAKIDLFWASPGEFLARGIGFCSEQAGKVVSTCLSGFVVGNIHVVDVETVEAARRQGAAWAAARAFVAHCDAHDLVPHWDCMDANQASFNLARKLGFAEAARYAVYYFPLAGQSQ